MKFPRLNVLLWAVGMGTMIGCTLVVLFTVLFSGLNGFVVSISTNGFGEFWFEVFLLIFGLYCFIKYNRKGVVNYEN